MNEKIIKELNKKLEQSKNEAMRKTPSHNYYRGRADGIKEAIKIINSKNKR